MSKLELDARFWSKVKKTKTCWLWRGSPDQRGYGMFWFTREIYEKAHRAHWISKRGKISPQMILRHRCGDHRCVRLSHLKLVPHWRIVESAVKARLAKVTAPGREKRDRARFMKKVKKVAGCWLWQSVRDNGQYGRFWLRGAEWAAHHAALILFRGITPTSQCVMHSCDTPACVNPKHLKPATFKQNSADMLAKGRHRVGTQKLSMVEAMQLIAECRPGLRGELPRLAKKYKLTSTGVHDIITGKSFKHLAHLPRGSAASTEPVEENRAHGSQHGRAKLTEEDVRQMYKLREQGRTAQVIADQYGMKKPQTAAILRGDAWCHVYEAVYGSVARVTSLA